MYNVFVCLTKVKEINEIVTEQGKAVQVNDETFPASGERGNSQRSSS